MKEFIFSKVAGCNLTELNSSISIFKDFAKTVSFSELGTTFFKKYLPPSGHTTSFYAIRRLCDNEASYGRL